MGGGDTLLAAGAGLPGVPLPAADVRAVAAVGADRLLVALAPGDPAVADWPAFEPVPGQSWVDLDRVVADARAASLAGPRRRRRDGRVAASPARRPWCAATSGPPTPVTRVALADATGLAAWLGPAVRRTDVLLASERVALFPAPLTGRLVALADPAAAADLPPGRTLLVVGRRYPGAPGPPDDRVGEQAVVAGTTAAGIVLAEPLRETYHPGATTVFGNVVVASHGETVDREVLGSGDPGQHQPDLRPRPRAADLPPGRHQHGAPRARCASTSATCRGPRWRRSSEAGPRDQVYETHQDADGVTTVVFGDGRPRRPAAERHRERRRLVPLRARAGR